jgi:periplasmic protein TonB
MTLRPVWLAGAFLGALAVHAAIFLQFDTPKDRSAASERNDGILVALGTPTQTAAGGDDEADQNVEERPDVEADPPEPSEPQTAATEPEQPDDPALDTPQEDPAEPQSENAPPEATSVEVPVDAVSEITDADLAESAPVPANVIAETEPEHPVPDPLQDPEIAPEQFDPPVDARLVASPLPEFRPEHTAPPTQQNSQNPEPRRSSELAASGNTNTESQQAQTGGGNDAERADYLTRLHGQLVRSRRYPQSARRDGIEGVVQIGLTIDRTGRVTAFRITRGSGFDILDEEVRNMIDRVQPLPRMPASMELSQITINMAIRFKLE